MCMSFEPDENAWTPRKILIYCRWTSIRCVCVCVCHLLNSFLSSRSFILFVSSVFDRFSVGNWITRLTQNKCVNGFSSKIKRNVIKMMSLCTAILINKHSCYIPIQLFNSTNSDTDSDSRQIFWIFLPP